jgi:hypothetical protein
MEGKRRRMGQAFLEDLLIYESLDREQILGDGVNKSPSARPFLDCIHSIIGRLSLSLYRIVKHLVAHAGNSRQMPQGENNRESVGYQLLSESLQRDRRFRPKRVGSFLIQVVC